VILLLDVGNSRVKAATAEAGQLGSVTALAHAGDPAAVVAALPAQAPQAIAVANVTGADHGQRLADALQARYGLAARFARSEAECAGLRVAYAQPERLGVDRWLMMLALWCESGRAFGVGGAGTALTYDAVDAQGRHLGGFIAAGLATHLQAVLGATRFPTQALAASYTGGLGQDTEACVRQGAFLACVGALQRGAQLQPDAPQVLSGGDAALLHAQLPQWSLRPQLVLEGLLVWAQRSL